MVLPDIVEEAQRIIEQAENNNVILRLFGGLAIRLRSPTATHRSLIRKYADIDFMGLSKQSRDIKRLFVDLGYVPRDIFNAFQGNKRLIFNDIEHERRVDIFLDVFEMCHKFDFRNRLLVDKLTIPLADLLATKLQVVEITEREYRDIIALVYDNEIGESDGQQLINGHYLARLCAKDWGFYKTLTTNISNTLSALPSYELDTEYQDVVRRRLKDLTTRIENEPKTMGWKVRARVGEKVKWYELPERDKEIVDSRMAARSD
jgi:hypothetical protein